MCKVKHYGEGIFKIRGLGQGDSWVLAHHEEKYIMNLTYDSWGQKVYEWEGSYTHK
jgi:hypothetical protein